MTGSNGNGRVGKRHRLGHRRPAARYRFCWCADVLCGMAASAGHTGSLAGERSRFSRGCRFVGPPLQAEPRRSTRITSCRCTSVVCSTNSMLAVKGMRFPIDVILVCIRWYAAYPLSYRHLEEMMQERGVFVDHFSINRWAIRFLPSLEKAFREHKHPVGGSRRMDETYIKVKGAWKYLYRAVDNEGKTVDFLPTARRNKAAALRFFDKIMQASGVPEKVIMDKSGANKAAMDEINARGETPVIKRPSQIPQQHRPAGPSSHQTRYQADVQLQVISICQKVSWPASS